MTKEAFEMNLALWGANLAAWPAHLTQQAQTFLNAHPHLWVLIEQEEKLTQLLNQYSCQPKAFDPAPMLHNIPRISLPQVFKPLTLKIPLLFLFIAIGFFVGFITPPPTLEMDDLDHFVLDISDELGDISL